jgi:hypothetical protein
MAPEYFNRLLNRNDLQTRATLHAARAGTSKIAKKATPRR